MRNFTKIRFSKITKIFTFLRNPKCKTKQRVKKESTIRNNVISIISTNTIASTNSTSTITSNTTSTITSNTTNSTSTITSNTTSTITSNTTSNTTSTITSNTTSTINVLNLLMDEILIHINTYNQDQEKFQDHFSLYSNEKTSLYEEIENLNDSELIDLSNFFY